LKVPFFDLKKQNSLIEDEILKCFKKVCRDSQFSDGLYVQEFEKKFADYCSSKYAIALNSGTSALHLALLTLNIGKGDEVILPANTFISTAWAVSYVGAEIVFVDCEPRTWQICPDAVERSITKKTKLIIGVHLYGQPFNVTRINEIAKKYDLNFIEDAAQAHGAKYNNKIVGTFGEMACFSFYPSKNLGAYGEGGCITTNNTNYDKKIRMLRNHGSQKKYKYDFIGFNMRMGGLEGAVLNIKLKYIKDWNKRRVEIAQEYLNNIINPKIKMQKSPRNSESVFHLFVITTNERNKLKLYLENRNIQTGKHYPIPCHLQKAYENLGYKKNDFPQAEYLARSCLSLPMFPEMTDKMVAKVIDELNNY